MSKGWCQSWGWQQGLTGQGQAADKCTVKILEKGVQAAQVTSLPKGLE